MSNLRLINETTVGTDVFSINVEDVFSTDFDIYKVTIFGIERTSGSTQTRIHMRYIDSGGSVEAGSTYEYATYRLKSSDSYTEANSTSATYQQYGQIDEYPEGAGFVGYIFNPNNSIRIRIYFIRSCTYSINSNFI